MLRSINNLRTFLALGVAMVVMLAAGCISPKTANRTATLLKTTNATDEELRAEVNRFAGVDSMRAKMDLKFEDNSAAQYGTKDVYWATDGEVVVQRPASIRLKVQVLKMDIAQMTSDGEKFRVAILQDKGSGRLKKFVKGTNAADYTSLEDSLESVHGGDGKDVKQEVNAFKNIRPQHFTDALLVRPIDPTLTYTKSTISQTEEDPTAGKKSPLRTVVRGYYLLDEYAPNTAGGLVIRRRFWFDRVGSIRLARQQLFDAKGEIESDILYGAEGSLTDTGQFARLPLQITVSRPQEKYSMRLTYQVPTEVTIGRKYPETAFVLENTWGLEEIDLDKKLTETSAQQPAPPSSAVNSNSARRFQ